MQQIWQIIRDSYASKAIKLGLERVNQVWQELEIALPKNIITVAGTNGKGSSCAMLEAIYSAQGYKVGLYTSPHLLSFHERIRINQKPIDDIKLNFAFECVSKLSSSQQLSQFELDTLVAVYIMSQEELDLAILEVGLGGRLDAVNIFSPNVSLVTAIDLDHCDWLGDTREKIALEKAGIFRTAKAAICSDAQPPQSLINYAQQIAADLRLLGRNFGFDESDTGGHTYAREWVYWESDGKEKKRRVFAPPCLRGEHQYYNASGVIAVTTALQQDLPVTLAAIRQGLANPIILGRFQIIPGRPAIILDVAHNQQSAKSLASNLRSMGFFRKTYAIIGMLADKDIAGSMAAMEGVVDEWLLVTLDTPRGARAEDLKAFLPSNQKWQMFDAVHNALQFAKQESLENDRIVIFGSFVTVAAALQLILG